MIAPRWRAVAVTVAGAIVRHTSRRIMSSLAQQSYAGLGAPHRTLARPRGASEPVLPPQGLARVSNRPRHDERLTDPIAPLLDVPYAATRGLRVVNMAGQKDGMGGPRNRTGRTHDPYSTPLRDANRDRLYGMLTARAAATLLTYLTELNKTTAQFFQEYMAAHPIPYAYWESGKVKDVSGETFIQGLLTMGPRHIDEKYRQSYITVDPPALAVRLLDIRLALRDEFVADLAWVKEENADIMKVACMSNLESSVSLDCDIDFDTIDEDDNFGGIPEEEYIPSGEERDDGPSWSYESMRGREIQGEGVDVD